MKKKSLRTLVSLLTCMVMLVTMFSACSQASKPAENSSSSGTQQSAPAAGANEFPIVKQPLTLTLWMRLSKSSTSMNDLNNMAAFQEMEKATGIHINFKHPPAGQEKDQFNLMIASGDLPDLIWGGGYSFPNDAEALANKQIIALNDLVAKYAPNYNKVLNDYPNFRKTMSTDDNNLIGIGFCQPFIEAGGIGGPDFRKDWLDKLGLKIPTTIDEWETVLTAFKEKDPNGNGKADEIPFDSSKNGAIMELAVAWGVLKDFYVEGGAQKGQIRYGPIQPAFKEFIIKMADWYKKGLINKDYLVTDDKLRTANITGNKTGSTWGNMHGNLGDWTGLMRNDPKFVLWPAPRPKLKSDGKIYANLERALSLSPYKGYITTKNKYPVESIRWFDWGYTQAGQMAFNFGRENESYKMVDGYPKYTDLILNNPDKLSTANAIAKYSMANMEFTFVQHPAYVEQIVGSSASQRQALKTWKTGWPDSPEQNLGMPPITLTSAEEASDKSALNDIKTYTDEMLDKFITGQEPLTKYDDFVKQLKNMGVDQCIKVRQTALERWRKRCGVEYVPTLVKFVPNYKNAVLITQKGMEYIDPDLK